MSFLIQNDLLKPVIDDFPAIIIIFSLNPSNSSPRPLFSIILPQNPSIIPFFFIFYKFSYLQILSLTSSLINFIFSFITIPKTLLLALLLLLSTAANIQTEQQDSAALPFLPLFVGKGYHVLYGNPLSGKDQDPGFTDQVFQFTYLKNFTTPDNLYAVPDQTTVQGLDSCSLSSTVNRFRGTKSYQDNLQTKARVANQSKLFNYKFSTSLSYQTVDNLTIAYNEVVDAEAVCEYNQLIVNKNELPKLSASFVASALHAQEISNWAGFVSTYGTHYVNDVIMGARVTQQTVYTYQGISRMNGAKMDIVNASKASFAKRFGDTSFDFNKYEYLIKYSESSWSTKSQFYEGVAPVYGDLNKWIQLIRKQPAPIIYKLSPITDLLSLIKDPKFDYSSAIYQLNYQIDNECAKVNCKLPRQDFSPAPAATNQVYTTGTYGNTSHSGRIYFKDFENTTINQQVRGIGVCFTSTYIYAVKLLISDGITERWTNYGGKCSNNTDIWRAPQGEYINKLWFKYNSYMNCLSVITNKGNGSPIWGHNVGVYREFAVPDDRRIVGFEGTYTIRICTLGLFISKPIYAPTPTNSTRQIAKLQ